MPMRYKKEEGRPYRRYKHTAEEQREIRANGFTPVVSSNVSAIARDGTILYIRFLDSATYAYPKSGELYEDMLNSKSKGKFVWNKLIRPRVPYSKAPSKQFSLDSDIDAPLNLMEEFRDRKVEQPKISTIVSDSKLSTLLTGLALSTLINADEENGFITSLELVENINSNATINAVKK